MHRISNRGRTRDDDRNVLSDILWLDNDHVNDTRRRLMPSLRHMSIVSVVSALWNHATVRDEMLNFYQSSFMLPNFLPDDQFIFHDKTSTPWKKLEDIVFDEVSKLFIPECVREMLADAVKPIGKEIWDWIIYQDQHVFYVSETEKSAAVHYLHDLVWTPRGRIDYAKTAKVLLSEEGLSDDTKYQIACTYCLEDDVYAMAPRVLCDGYLERLRVQRNCRGDSWIMTRFWTCRLAKGRSMQNILGPYDSNKVNIPSVFTDLISHYRLIMTNPVPIKYVWQQLSMEEWEIDPEYMLRCMNNTDLTFFFLSQVPSAKREKVLKKSSSLIVLRMISDWLWKDYFLDVIRPMWDNMSFDFYFTTLMALGREMAVNSQMGKRSVRLQDKIMLRGFWEETPDHLKQYIFTISTGTARMLFWNLCRQNVGLVMWMLSSASSQQKRELIRSKYCIERCTFFILSGQWDLIETLVACTLSCKDDVENFKKNIVKENGRAIFVRLVEKNELDKLEQFLERCFDSKEERDEFVQQMVRSSKIIVRRLAGRCYYQRNADFTGAENFLRWIYFKHGVKQFRVTTLYTGTLESCNIRFICDVIWDDDESDDDGVNNYEVVEMTFDFFNSQSFQAQFLRYP